MSSYVYPCRFCRQLLSPTDLVVDLVELIPAGLTPEGRPDILEGHHDFAHTKCFPPGAELRGLREITRGEALEVALKRLGS